MKGGGKCIFITPVFVISHISTPYVCVRVRVHVCVTSTEAPVPVLSRHPDWPQNFIGETLTLKCTIQESASDWKYRWWRDNNIMSSTYLRVIGLTFWV